MLFYACRALVGNLNFFTVSFIPSFLSSLVAILVERPSRRGLLSLYVTNVVSLHSFSFLTKMYLHFITLQYRYNTQLGDAHYTLVLTTHPTDKTPHIRHHHCWWLDTSQCNESTLVFTVASHWFGIPTKSCSSLIFMPFS